MACERSEREELEVVLTGFWHANVLRIKMARDIVPFYPSIRCLLQADMFFTNFFINFHAVIPFADELEDVLDTDDGSAVNRLFLP